MATIEHPREPVAAKIVPEVAKVDTRSTPREATAMPNMAHATTAGKAASRRASATRTLTTVAKIMRRTAPAGATRMLPVFPV